MSCIAPSTIYEVEEEEMQLELHIFCIKILQLKIDEYFALANARSSFFHDKILELLFFVEQKKNINI